MNPRNHFHPLARRASEGRPQHPSLARRASIASSLIASLFVASLTPAQQAKSYNLKPVDLKERIIWGSVCELPDGTGLAFGGQDQKSDDGIGHTRVKVNGEWKDISDELRKASPTEKKADTWRSRAVNVKCFNALVRTIFFNGLPAHTQRMLLEGPGSLQVRATGEQWAKLQGYDLDDFRKDADSKDESIKARAQLVIEPLESFVATCGKLKETEDTAEIVKLLATAQRALEQLADRLSAEPSPRALSVIAYDAKTKLFVIFGGDHLDYLTNDTWVFDLAKKKWEQRHPKTAPPPRANHTLKANGDGKIVLSGGYTYTSSTDYVGGQYRDHNDGDWTYDIEANTWKGSKDGVEPNQRVYRTGPFHPDFYLQGPKPDAAANQAKLQAIAANTWVAMKPPQLPRLNRDWGTAVLDPDRDLILRFSGGHSAHGGTDVLHYHLASNRWELPFPVEFPLGQLYSNTSYPEGFNFNRRPWVTGHTYQNYGYDTVSKKMYFTGRDDGQCYVYDPTVADWGNGPLGTGRFPKPKGMIYGSCFYTLTNTSTPQGLVCWTQAGKLFRFDAAKKEWTELTVQGKLPGAVVDNSTLWYDSKRERLCFVSKGYGDKTKFDGQIHAVDLKTLTVSQLSPKGMEAAETIPYLCQLRYDPMNDLVLVGGLLPEENGFRRTPAYDPAENRWVSLKIPGDDPNGKSGRNVSLGLVYDARRKLFWAVDTNSQVFVLKLEPKTADVQPLK